MSVEIRRAVVKTFEERAFHSCGSEFYHRGRPYDGEYYYRCSGCGAEQFDATKYPRLVYELKSEFKKKAPAPNGG